MYVCCNCNVILRDRKGIICYVMLLLLLLLSNNAINWEQVTSWYFIKFTLFNMFVELAMGMCTINLYSEKAVLF